MTITTIRVSDTEVQVERTLSHPPMSAQPTMPGQHPDDPGRGSTISPPLGDMP